MPMQRNASELEWGLKDAAITAPALWGARCYVEEWRSREVKRVRGKVRVADVLKKQLALLPDRQGAIGEEADRKALIAELDGGLLDKLRRMVRDDLLFEGERWEASNRRARLIVLKQGGYLYVTAALKGPTDAAG